MGGITADQLLDALIAAMLTLLNVRGAGGSIRRRPPDDDDLDSRSDPPARPRHRRR